MYYTDSCLYKYIDDLSLMYPSFEEYKWSQRGLTYLEGVNSFRMMYNIKYRDVLGDSFRRCLDYENYDGIY